MAIASVLKTTTAAPAPVVRGFACLPCPLCGDEAGNVSVDLSNVSAFSCSACGDEFDRATVERFIRTWTAVLAWLDTAPVAK